MARLSLDTSRRSVLARAIAWYGRRQYGAVPEPLLALAHHTGVLWVTLRMELGVAGRWRKLSPTLRCLATMAPAARIGCSWCMDFGYYVAHHDGVDRAKIEAVPHWRDSDAYTDVERLVLEYADAMTETPPAVTDELVAALREHLSDAQVVELTSLVSLENLRSRTNTALGLESQGFRAQCEWAPRPAL
jgi:alkylhydroperoxidase family enzyme